MKVDVEGFEARFIRGASQSLGRVANMILEYTPSEYQKDGCNGDAIIDAVLGVGLQLVHKFEGKPWTTEEIEDFKKKSNQANFTQADLMFSRKTAMHAKPDSNE